jgi:predicted RNA binding protein YcfA (HicA-like mRNA interferase family)
LKIPRDVHGQDFADHLVRRWGFRRDRQVGSHVVLVSEQPAFSVSIPAHKPMKLGLFADLLHFVAERKGVAVEDILHKL